MNEDLIEQLARQAGMTQAAGTSFTGMATSPQQRAKFAALIAEECARICDSTAFYEDDPAGYSGQSAREIRRHFGL